MPEAGSSTWAISRSTCDGPCGAMRPYSARCPAQSVDGLGTLADEEVSGPEDHGGRLLRLALYGHEAHGRPLGGFADRLGIRHVVLLALDERLHVGRRDQPHLVTEIADCSSPVMRARAGLHGDAAARLTREEGQHLLAPELLAEQNTAGCARAVRLEHVLGQVQADGANPFHGRLPPVVPNTTTLARRCRRGASTPSLEEHDLRRRPHLPRLHRPLCHRRPDERRHLQGLGRADAGPGAAPGRHRDHGQSARPQGRRYPRGDRGPERRAALPAALFPRPQPDRAGHAKLKALLRKAAERTVDGLWNTIGKLLDLFPPATGSEPPIHPAKRHRQPLVARGAGALMAKRWRRPDLGAVSRPPPARPCLHVARSGCSWRRRSPAMPSWARPGMASAVRPAVDRARSSVWPHRSAGSPACGRARA